MEIEGILAHGCGKALQELMTVKSDWNEEKRAMLKSIVKDGTYCLPARSTANKDCGKTKKVIDTIIKFLTE